MPNVKRFQNRQLRNFCSNDVRDRYVAAASAAEEPEHRNKQSIGDAHAVLYIGSQDAEVVCFVGISP